MQTDTGRRVRAQVLLEQIAARALCDRPKPMAFEERLADEQHWSFGHATQVTREYRRFLVLTQVAGHMVCPSADVDEAWHLHLTQSRAYADLCVKVFGEFLHHEPSRGGEQELARHREIYAHTLQSYERLFGEAAPPAIWPDVSSRFAAAPVQSGPALSALSLRLPALVSTRLGLFAAALISALLAAVLSSRLGDWLVWRDMSICAVVGLYASVLGALSLMGLYVRHRELGRLGRIAAPADLDTYEVAWLQGGVTRMAATVVAEGVARGWFRLETLRSARGRIWAHKLVCQSLPPDPPDPACVVHPVVADALHGGPGQTLRASAFAWRLSAAGASTQRRLAAAGLAWLPGQRPATRMALWALATLALCLASTCYVQVQVQPEIAHILISLMLLNLALIARLSAAPRATPLGLATLKRMKKLLRASPDVWPPRSADPHTRQRALELVPMSFAMLGAAAVVADPDFTGINAVLLQKSQARTADRGGSGGCSGAVFGDGSGASGCGAGGDGGGGGCGGGG